MIQRIQSIFLALAAGAVGGLFALPFAKTPEAVANSSLFADSVYNINDHLLLLVAFSLAGLLSLIAIFLYKRRKLQMNISVLAILATVVGLGFGLFTFLNSPAKAEATFGFGAILPILIILFAFLGWRNIKKDDKLVKSMHRLR